SRQALVRRMREAMIKCIILNGIPIVMEAFVSLAAVERPEDREHGFTRQGWQADEKNHKRGLDVLNILYRGENDRIWGTFGAHRDIPWLSTDISYGLFLANHTILDIVESELVILPAITCQNLNMATHWHLRGCLRVGISRDEVEEIQSVIHAIAEACGKNLNKIGSISDVEDDH
ncbi:AhpD-like protein, partial [Leptodontidium sp. 2 PMI_412]